VITHIKKRQIKDNIKKNDFSPEKKISKAVISSVNMTGKTIYEILLM
jgi:hypothetical protein